MRNLVYRKQRRRNQRKRQESRQSKKKKKKRVGTIRKGKRLENNRKTSGLDKESKRGKGGSEAGFSCGLYVIS